jgi:hypothetical protein
MRFRLAFAMIRYGIEQFGARPVGGKPREERLARKRIAASAL